MWRSKRIIATLLAALCLAGCAANQSEQTPPAAPKVEKTNYKLATVQEGTFRKTEKTVGNPVYTSQYLVCEYDDATLKENMPIGVGNQVKKGDVLATFTQKTSDTELARLELNYERAVANMENGISRHYSQIAAIKGSGSIPRMQRNQAENSLALYKMSAEKECQAALKALEEYKLRYEDKQLISPVDGRVNWLQPYAVGDKVAKGTLLFHLYEDTHFYIRIDNPSESFLRMTAPGTPVTITYMNKRYEGEVVSTPNGIRDLSSRSIYVYSEDVQGVPRVGTMSVEYTQLELENMLMVDKAAIRSDDTADYVMVLKDGVAMKQHVVCGPSNNEVVCILDGLQAGQQVVLN